MVFIIKNELVTKSKKSGSLTGTVDIEDWSRRVGLDLIGKAGFGSDCNSLSNLHAPLTTVYRKSFVADSTSYMIFFLSILTHPSLVRLLPLKKNREVREGVAMVSS